MRAAAAEAARGQELPHQEDRKVEARRQAEPMGKMATEEARAPLAWRRWKKRMRSDPAASGSAGKVEPTRKYHRRRKAREEARPSLTSFASRVLFCLKIDAGLWGL